MGWFDGTSVVSDDRHRRHGSHSHSHRRRSSSADKKKTTSRGSIFGLGDDHHSSSHHNASRSSFLNYFAGATGGRSSSYYKRSPRRGFVSRMLHQLRRLLRDLVYYAKKNPIKVFMLVIMPLITGGALTGLLSRFGIRLPHGLERMVRAMGGGSSGGVGVGRGRDGSLQFERETYEGPLGGVGAAMGAMGGASGLMNVAKMFI